MPAVPAGIALVTGANGYVAVWAIKQLLEQGYSVRGTIRCMSKADHLRTIFHDFVNRLEFVVVEDFAKDDAFDEAVRGVDVIHHIASPFHLKAEEPSEIIAPAVSGTVSVLKSAQKYGENLKRVVIVSSTAAVFELTGEPQTCNEENWNDHAIYEVAVKGKDADQFSKYCASKTIAERAAWNFYINNKQSFSWDMVVINPPYVFGPILHEVRSISDLNTSLEHWYYFVLSGHADAEIVTNDGNCWIDVRDLANALVLATHTGDAGNQRIIVSAGPFKWQDWVVALRDLVPPMPNGSHDPRIKEPIHIFQNDTSKASKILGLTYRSREVSAREMLTDFQSRGWVGTSYPP